MNHSLKRRDFFKIFGVVIGILFFYLWTLLITTEKKLKKLKVVIFPLNSIKKVLFKDDIILVYGKEKKAFSAHCSHLGCTIKTENNGKLFCPCHGSVFNLNGEVLKGPAIKPLDKFTVKTTDKNIVVYA